MDVQPTTSGQKKLPSGLNDLSNFKRVSQNPKSINKDEEADFVSDKISTRSPVFWFCIAEKNYSGADMTSLKKMRF